MADWFDTKDVVEVVVKGQAENQAVVNVLRFVTQETPAAVDTGDLALFLGNFRTFWRTSMLPLATNNYFVDSYNAAVITGRNANPHPQPNPIGNWTPFILQYAKQAILAGVGADFGSRGAVSVMPTFNAAAVRWLPGLRTRWARSGCRFYIGQENDTTNNEWNNTAGFTADVATAVTALVGGIVCNAAGDKLKLVAFGKTTYLKRPPGLIVPWAFTTYVLGGILNRYVSSQVSRKQRVRPQ